MIILNYFRDAASMIAIGNVSLVVGMINMSDWLNNSKMSLATKFRGLLYLIQLWRNTNLTKSRRTFTPEFKAQMVKLYENGKPRKDIIREFDQQNELSVVVSDFTYVRVEKRWHYICLFVDLYNREIIGHIWELIKMQDLSIKPYRH
jgi:hypothetical protein